MLSILHVQRLCVIVCEGLGVERIHQTLQNQPLINEKMQLIKFNIVKFIAMSDLVNQMKETNTILSGTGRCCCCCTILSGTAVNEGRQNEPPNPPPKKDL